MINSFLKSQHLLEPVEVLVVSPEPAEGLGGFTGLLPEGVQGPLGQPRGRRGGRKPEF